MKEKLRIEFEMEQKMCTSCKRSSNEYYQLKTQIRFYGFKEEEIGDLADEVKTIIINHFETINKVEDTENGFDVFFRSHGEKNKVNVFLNRKYFCEEVVSKRLVGRDHLGSRDIYRYTQKITIINIKKGKKISYKGEEYAVNGTNKKEISLMDIKGVKHVYTYPKIKEYLKFIE